MKLKPQQYDESANGILVEEIAENMYRVLLGQGFSVAQVISVASKLVAKVTRQLKN